MIKKVNLLIKSKLSYENKYIIWKSSENVSEPILTDKLENYKMTSSNLH